jgi:hypothetical protein
MDRVQIKNKTVCNQALPILALAGSRAPGLSLQPSARTHESYTSIQDPGEKCGLTSQTVSPVTQKFSSSAETINS